MPRPWRLGRPCVTCGRVQLVDSRGIACCLSCERATSDAPLVPLDWPTGRILRVQHSYKEHRRAPDYRKPEPDDFPRFVPATVNWEIPRPPAPVFQDPLAPPKTRPNARRGAPPKLTVEKVRSLFEKLPGASLAALAERLGVDQRTLRRFRKARGLSRPARGLSRPARGARS